MKALAILLIPSVLFGLFDLSLSLSSDLTDEFFIGIDLPLESFYASAELRISNDGRFFDPAHNRFYFGHYFQVTKGWIEYDSGGLKIKAGRFVPKDEVDSPYSLFISSERNSFVSALISYENKDFFFKTEWLGLTNKFNDLGVSERGANYRVFGIKLGKIRIGYQEAVIYTERYFDFEYFFNPVPNFFTQYTRLNTVVVREGTNDSSILGFFTDYSNGNSYFYAQILVDDFNMNRFYGGFQNPDKIAWSIGGGLKTRFGEFKLYHAGATKYTFEPSLSGLHDEYFHYPTLTVHLGSSTRTLLPQEGYIGYKYGENNIAFLFEYSPLLEWIDLFVGFEHVISGVRSPINPWHEEKDVPEGTHLLDDEILEKLSRFYLKVSKKFENLKVFLTGEYVRVQNPSEVLDASDGDGEMFVPMEGEESSLWVKIGFEISF